MIYTLEEIKNIVLPIAEKYSLKAVYLFGSYARGTANEDSDIDLLIDTEGSGIKGLFQLGAVYCDFEEAFGKEIDLITVSSINQEMQMPSEAYFRNNVLEERVVLYAEVA